jgi:hypothetical protein
VAHATVRREYPQTLLYVDGCKVAQNKSAYQFFFRVVVFSGKDNHRIGGTNTLIALNITQILKKNGIFFCGVEGNALSGKELAERGIYSDIFKLVICTSIFSKFL